MERSSLFDSDFSEYNYTTSSESEESEIIKPPEKVKPEKPKPEKPKPEKPKPEKSVDKILVTSTDLVIEKENIILLDSHKRCKVILPFINDVGDKTSKGLLYKNRSITILTSGKKSCEHIIMVSGGNYINGNSTFYILKNSKSVIFYSVGKSWYADR